MERENVTSKDIFKRDEKNKGAIGEVLAMNRSVIKSSNLLIEIICQFV